MAKPPAAAMPGCWALGNEATPTGRSLLPATLCRPRRRPGRAQRLPRRAAPAACALPRRRPAAVGRRRWRGGGGGPAGRHLCCCAGPLRHVPADGVAQRAGALPAAGSARGRAARRRQPAVAGGGGGRGGATAADRAAAIGGLGRQQGPREGGRGAAGARPRCCRVDGLSARCASASGNPTHVRPHQGHAQLPARSPARARPSHAAPVPPPHPAGERLLMRSADGRALVFDWGAKSLLAQWRVPGCEAQGASHHSKCGVSHTADGALVCTGEALRCWPPQPMSCVPPVAVPRSSEPVNAPALSPHTPCRQPARLRVCARRAQRRAAGAAGGVPGGRRLGSRLRGVRGLQVRTGGGARRGGVAVAGAPRQTRVPAACPRRPA
jgi:hypothetical protein